MHDTINFFEESRFLRKKLHDKIEENERLRKALRFYARMTEQLNLDLDDDDNVEFFEDKWHPFGTKAQQALGLKK